MMLKPLFFSFILLIGSTSCQEFDTQDYINLLKNNETIQNFYLPHLGNYVQFIDYILNDEGRNISSQCENDLNHLKSGLLNKEKFAIQFYEANAKHSSGILTGSDGDLGNFEQCLSIETTNNGLDYKGKYCLISVQTGLSYTIKSKEVYLQSQVELSDEGRLSMDMNSGTIYGTCVPNSCNLQNLLNSLNKEIKRFEITVLGQPDRYCSSNDATHNYEPFKWLEIICLSIVMTFVILCLLAFHYENRFFNFFSIKKNFKKIYRVPEDYDQNNYNFIHGFKAIYVILSACVHACGILYIFAPFLYAPLRNYSEVNPFVKGLLKRLLVGPDIAVFIGGFLGVVTWQVVFSQKRGNFFLYVFSRFMRTIPIMISMLLLNRIWPRLLGSVSSGPYYRQITDHLQRNCDRSFWKLFAFVSNQDRALDICQTPSWFISVDFQLYVAHYWTIKYLIQKPKLGLCLAFLQIVCMSIYSAQNIYLNDLEPYFNSFNVYFYNTIRFEKQYFISSIHSNSYTCGVLIGWLVMNNRKFEFFKSKLNRFGAFFLAILSVMSSLYFPDLILGEYSYLPKDDVPRSILLSIWGAIYRPIYLSFFLFTFYFMSLGYFKFGRSILSMHIMLPFSRLSFTIIMTQFLYLWYNIATRKTHFLVTPFDLCKEAVFSLAVSLIIGNLVFAFLEAPLQNILFCLTGMDKKKARLKLDCSSARLSSEIQEHILRDQANQLFENNKSSKNPSINVVLFDENSNQNLVKSKFQRNS